MKKLFSILLCALLAAAAAEAKTYYVDASRPNNNGNGLKLSTAKKTIQAAINLAKAGDTVLVYPGQYYAPIKTNNRKITVKSVKGSSKTKIVKTSKHDKVALAQLGKTYLQWTGGEFMSSVPYTKGKATTLSGFLLDGRNQANGLRNLLGVSGGTVKSCSIQRLGRKDIFYDEGIRAAAHASLTRCTILDNHGTAIAENSVLVRCTIQNNTSDCYVYRYGDNYDELVSGGAVFGSRLSNCLITDNRFRGTSGTASHFTSSTLVNCTIAKNRIGWSTAPFSLKSKYYNCILRNNWRGKTGKRVHNTDSGNTYSWTNKTNKDPKFVDEAAGNYKLAKGSPCIDNGKVQDAIKSHVGSLDLAGVKRIRGKAIDRGCYEY